MHTVISRAGTRSARVNPSTFVALLRGINVGGHNRVPMADLRSLAGDLGWTGVKSYVQSGNLIFQAADRPAKLAQRLEHGLEARLGLAIPVIVKAAADWSRYAAGNPFPDASQREPNLVMLALSKEAPKQDALAGLRQRAAGEHIEQVDEAIWIHYAAGVVRSRLSPGLLDRAVGSPVTTRNWRTVLMLGALAGEIDGSS